METAITALIVIGVLILALMGMTQSVLTSQAALSDSIREMQERTGARARTILTPDSALTTPGGDFVQIALQNSGTTLLTDFSRWDVVLRYTDEVGVQRVQWYAYSSQWVGQIYQSLAPAAPEVFDPGILNPGEILVIQISVAPPVGSGTTNAAIVSAPNGVTAMAVFTH